MTENPIARETLLSVVVLGMLWAAFVVDSTLDLSVMFLLLAVGVAAGVFGGLIGVGGSTIMLPVMYFALGFP